MCWDRRVTRTYRASCSNFSTPQAGISRSSTRPLELFSWSAATLYCQRRRAHTKTWSWPSSMAASIHHNRCSARTWKIDGMGGPSEVSHVGLTFNFTLRIAPAMATCLLDHMPTLEEGCEYDRESKILD